MHDTLRNNPVEIRQTGGVPDETITAAPLLEVLWRRRWTLGMTICACVLCAMLYLYLATPVYIAMARVAIEEHAPKVLDESRESVVRSENFMQTQADVFQSTPVLSLALDHAQYGKLKTFADVTGDPVAWLRHGNSLKVDVEKKTDVIAVSMESPYPAEAAAIVQSVVNAYVSEQSKNRHATGADMVAVLQRERDELQLKRDEKLQSMLMFKRNSGVASFSEEKGNTVLDRVAALAGALNTAEIATIDLATQQESAKAALTSPESVAIFVQAQQARGRDSGDREYDDLRSQLNQTELALSSSATVLGRANSRMQTLKSMRDALKTRLVEKERMMAEAQLSVITSQLAAAKQKENQIRAALKAQQDVALDQSRALTEYHKLEADADRLQKQCDVLDSRIAEVRVNSAESSPLSIRVLEPALADEKPAKPNKMLVLAGAMMMGWLVGLGLALLRENQDVPLRYPEEIRSALGTSVIAMIPQINSRLSSLTRGQLVRFDARSPAAEGYRSVRTLLQLGNAANAKTILMASPASGDGKSTTASNLAIALAQSGERTLLIDCDLRMPVQHMIFEMTGNAGISTVLSGETKLRDAIRPAQVAGLYVLPCGPVPENPSELLTSKRFARLMQSLSKAFDRIVIDSSPLMHVTDARILAAAADVTLLVLRMNRSVRSLGIMALDGLEKVGANVLGAVANDVPAGHAAASYYGNVAQYETDSRRMLTLAAGGAQDNGKSESIVRKAEQEMDRVLTIHEPDWTTDVHA